jgi:formate dehydrogenase maturation protein FdhE
MQVLEAAAAATANPWPLRRERAAELAQRYPHAAEILHLYQALTVVQEAAYQQARSALPRLEEIADFAAARVLPAVVDATVSSGPTKLRDGVIALYATANLEEVIQRWLDQESLPAFETYLARASASPLLEALMSPHPHPPPQGGRENEGQGGGSHHCPACGGLPQLSYFALSGEALVSGPRYLVCARCSHNWVFSRMTCAACGERETHRLPIYQEGEYLPHLRADACDSCHRYLLTIDLRKDARAISIVDELAGVPLDLYAQERGMTKITPNLLAN